MTLCRRLADHGVVNAAAARGLWREHLGGADHADSLGVILGIELWMRLFLDRDRPPTVAGARGESPVSGLVAIVSREPATLARGPRMLATLRHLPHWGTLAVASAGVWLGVCGRHGEFWVADALDAAPLGGLALAPLVAAFCRILGTSGRLIAHLGLTAGWRSRGRSYWLPTSAGGNGSSLASRASIRWRSTTRAPTSCSPDPRRVWWR